MLWKFFFIEQKCFGVSWHTYIWMCMCIYRETSYKHTVFIVKCWRTAYSLLLTAASLLRLFIRCFRCVWLCMYVCVYRCVLTLQCQTWPQLTVCIHTHILYNRMCMYSYCVFCCNSSSKSSWIAVNSRRKMHLRTTRAASNWPIWKFNSAKLTGTTKTDGRNVRIIVYSWQ